MMTASIPSHSGQYRMWLTCWHWCGSCSSVLALCRQSCCSECCIFHMECAQKYAPTVKAIQYPHTFHTVLYDLAYMPISLTSYSTRLNKKLNTFTKTFPNFKLHSYIHQLALTPLHSPFLPQCCTPVGCWDPKGKNAIKNSC